MCSNTCSVDLSFLYYIYIFCFSFPEEKYVKEKNQSVQDLSPPPSTYACVLCTHVRIHICQDLVHLDSSGSSSASSRPMGSHPSTPHAVYVCARNTHIHPHTIPPPSYNKANTDNTLIFFMSKITPHASNRYPA